jgi:hypothetical protein
MYGKLGLGLPACAIPEVIPLKLNVHFDCDLVLLVLAESVREKSWRQDSVKVFLRAVGKNLKKAGMLPRLAAALPDLVILL